MTSIRGIIDKEVNPLKDKIKEQEVLIAKLHLETSKQKQTIIALNQQITLLHQMNKLNLK
jgi:hypothetical protein